MTTDEIAHFSLCLLSFLLPCGPAKREPALATLSEWRRGVATVVSRVKFLKDLRVTLCPNEEHAEHFICAFAQSGKLSFSESAHFNARHRRNTARLSFCESNTEDVQRYLNIRLWLQLSNVAVAKFDISVLSTIVNGFVIVSLYIAVFQFLRSFIKKLKYFM